MTTQPTITGPLHRTNPFRTCSDADVAQNWNAATSAAMQALPYAQAGDTCVTADSDLPWLAVTRGKYPYGANCLVGTGASTVDWFFNIDRITGVVPLVAGHANVYIPNFPTTSTVDLTYRFSAPGVSIGQTGTLYYTPPTSTGFDIYSTAGEYDGNYVAFSCVLGA